MTRNELKRSSVSSAHLNPSELVLTSTYIFQADMQAKCKPVSPCIRDLIQKLFNSKNVDVDLSFFDSNIMVDQKLEGQAKNHNSRARIFSETCQTRRTSVLINENENGF